MPIPVARVRISASPIVSETFSEGGLSTVARPARIEARIFPSREANIHLVAHADHLGVHADRELVNERAAVGAGDIDRLDLAVGKGIDRGVERLRDCRARGQTGSSSRRAGSPAPSSCPSRPRPQPRSCRRRRRPSRRRHGLPRPWRLPPRCPHPRRARCRCDGQPSRASRSSCARMHRDRSCAACRRPDSEPQ